MSSCPEALKRISTLDITPTPWHQQNEPFPLCSTFICYSLLRTYNIREGQELALICRDRNNRNNNMIAWRRKVSPIPWKYQGSWNYFPIKCRCIFVTGPVVLRVCRLSTKPRARALRGGDERAIIGLIWVKCFICYWLVPQANNHSYSDQNTAILTILSRFLIF